MKKRFLPVLLVMFIIAAMIPTFALADSSEMSGKEFLALEKNGVINMTGKCDPYVFSCDQRRSDHPAQWILLEQGYVKFEFPGRTFAGYKLRLRNHSRTWYYHWRGISEN